MVYAEGDHVFKRVDPVNRVYVDLSGAFEIRLEQYGSYKMFDTVRQYDLSGFLPYSRATSGIGYGMVIEPTTILFFCKDNTRDLTAHYEVTEALVHQMTSMTTLIEINY